MRIFITYICFLSAILCVSAQTNVNGKLIDKENDEPVAGASVIVKDADGKIKKFTTSDTEGDFAIPMTSTAGYRLEVSMMGYAKKTVALDSVSFPLTLYMHPGATLLKEVTVKSQKIREQGDTITYSVGSFAQTQDRSIGDVLKRMPGIDVGKSGEIKYQGESINKFYIEGSDLLGGKYGIATQGIQHEDVKAVEVMENHQPLQVLSGISFSDKAAINLRLKDKAKATWNVHGDAATGYSAQPDGILWNGQIFAMAIMPSFQNMTNVRFNNTGEDLRPHNRDFFSSRRSTDLNSKISLSLPGTPSLSSTRTLFNRSALISTNNLWKLKNGEFKAQTSYSHNRIIASADNITTYFLPDGNRVITESRNGIEHSNSLSARFVYELNKKSAFINNTLRTDIDWNDIDIRTTGSITNIQHARLPDYYVNNDFSLIKRFRDKHLVTFKSTNEWESLPQTLTVTNDGRERLQHIGEHAFFTHERASYAFTVSGLTVGLETGFKGYFRSMDSEYSDISGSDSNAINALNTNYFTIYANPKAEYWLNRVNFILNLPLSYSRYTFDKALANRSESYFSPSMAMNWKPNNRFTIYLRGGIGRAPMSLDLVQPGFIMTNYRSFRRGTDNFYNTSSQNISANIAYKHTRHGLFANALILQSWSHIPYTLEQQLYGDYIIYSYSPAKSTGKRLMANADIGKTLNILRGSVNIKGGFSRNMSAIISESEPVSSTATSWHAGISLNSAPVRWISLDYSLEFSASRLTMNSLKADWLSDMENSLSINIIPHKKWELNIRSDHYRNEINSGDYKNALLLDSHILFRVSKKIELRASLNNIFDRRTYSYTSYSTVSSFESLRYLRGREFLISISLKK